MGVLNCYDLWDVMKSTLITMMLMLSFLAHSDEACDLETIGLDKNSDIVEQLYFTGTCHYRNKEYDLSVKSWEKLYSLKNINPAYEEYQIDVLNNLGYMKFFGYGTTKDQSQAIEYWKKRYCWGIMKPSIIYVMHMLTRTNQPIIL